MEFKTRAKGGEKWSTAVECDGRLFHRRVDVTGNTLSMESYIDRGLDVYRTPCSVTDGRQPSVSDG